MLKETGSAPHIGQEWIVDACDWILCKCATQTLLSSGHLHGLELSPQTRMTAVKGPGTKNMPSPNDEGTETGLAHPNGTQAAERLEFLVEVGDILASSIDFNVTL